MKSLVRRFSLAVAVAAMIVVAPLAQASPTGIVKGSVRGSAGPVSAAKVVMNSSTDSKFTATTTTDAGGGFTIAAAPLGGVSVRVYDANGKSIATAKGTLRQAGETITLVLQAP